MKMDQFPPEILMKIFSYLPKCENVALVNSRFYSVVCSIQRPIICLKLDHTHFDCKNNTKLQRIMKTRRKITKIELIVYSQRVNFGLMLALFRKFRTSIVYLKMEGYLEVTNFLQILSMVPNVVHLILVSIPCQLPRNLPLWSYELNLHHLKILDVFSCSNDIMLQFNLLPAGVLETVSLVNQDFDERYLFKMQTKIKNLVLDRTTLNNSDSLDGLRLQSLTSMASSFNNGYFPQMLMKQTELKSLELFHAVVDEDPEDVMNAITTHLTEFQSLSISIIVNIPSDSFVKIEKLKMLKQLKLEEIDVELLERFAEMDNSRITSLDIKCLDHISEDFITSLARSVPNLKILKIDSYLKNGTFNAIMQNFNFVEILQISCFHYNMNEISMEILGDGSCTNKQLKELIIFGKAPSLLEKLIKHYPNLNKLKLQIQADYTVEQCKMMMNGFTKLEVLSLVAVTTMFPGTVQLNVNDLYFLLEHRNNLQFIALGDLKIEFTSEVKENLMKMFNFVTFSESGCLRMAVSKETMIANL